MDRVVGQVAYRYARRVWWAEESELKQVGYKAAIEAERTFDPRVGVPETAYVRKAVHFAIRGFITKMVAPVTGGEQEERVKLHREFVDDEVLRCSEPTPEDQVDIQEHLQALRARMREVCSQVNGALDGLDSLLREELPASDGVTARDERGDAYKKRDVARRCLRDDRRLLMLLKRRED